MDVKKFEYFVAIAEEKSISRAAKRLYISQPALTQFLHNLESEVGTRLFERVGSQYLPTSAGRIYLNGAYSIIAIKRQTYTQIGESSTGRSGELTVALSHSQNVHRIHYLFLKMKERFPNIRLQALERSAEQCPETVTSGVADVGILSRPVVSRQLCQVPLWDDYPLLATGPSLSLDSIARQVPGSRFPVVRLEDVMDQTFITMTHTSHVRQLCDGLFRQRGLRPNIVFECPFVSSLLQILRETEYAAIVPMGLVDHDPAFRFYAIDNAPTWPVLAVYRSGMPLMEHHTYFLDILRTAPLLDRTIE